MDKYRQIPYNRPKFFIKFVLVLSPFFALYSFARHDTLTRISQR